MTVIEECRDELTRAGVDIIESNNGITALLWHADEIEELVESMPKWKFDLLCVQVHERTRHRCRVKVLR